jgi:hypothetical protein
VIRRQAIWPRTTCAYSTAVTNWSCTKHSTRWRTLSFLLVSALPRCAIIRKSYVDTSCASQLVHRTKAAAQQFQPAASLHFTWRQNVVKVTKKSLRRFCLTFSAEHLVTALANWHHAPFLLWSVYKISTAIILRTTDWSSSTSASIWCNHSAQYVT